MDSELISEKLRGLRAEKQLSMEKMANNLKIHRETFRKYENNPLNIPIGMFIEILSIYGTTPVYFFDKIMANSHQKD